MYDRIIVPTDDSEGSERVAALRDDPYRERATWVVPAVTESGESVNVHVDAASGDARVAHLG